jgi:hypothetical protein
MGEGIVFVVIRCVDKEATIKFSKCLLPLISEFSFPRHLSEKYSFWRADFSDLIINGNIPNKNLKRCLSVEGPGSKIDYETARFKKSDKFKSGYQFLSGIIGLQNKTF